MNEPVAPPIAQAVLELEGTHIRECKVPTKMKVAIPSIFSKPTTATAEADTSDVPNADSLSNEKGAEDLSQASVVPTKKKVSIPSIFDKPSHTGETDTNTIILQDAATDATNMNDNNGKDAEALSTLPKKKKVAIPSIFGQAPNNSATKVGLAPIRGSYVPKQSQSDTSAPIPSNNAPLMKKKVAIPSIFAKPVSQQTPPPLPVKVISHIAGPKKDLDIAEKTTVSSLTSGVSSHDTENTPPCDVTNDASRTKDVKVDVPKVAVPVPVPTPATELPNPTSAPVVRKRVAIPSIFGKPPTMTNDDDEIQPPLPTKRATKKLVIPSRFGGL